MDIKVVGSQNEIYQKQKLLGQGAFGKAYLVKRKADSQLLVIKQMNIDHMSQKEQKQTIKQAQILRNLNHPNIVRFVQVYVTKQNKLKIVMQYAQCGDLSKSISQHKKNKKYYTQNQILDWFTQICLAIKHVHDRKILHRDIKGQNIFITKNNTLKLGDFGIARVLNKTMQKARTVVGTPYYLSPQIIQNKPYSFKSDIWSIGVVLYQLCALTHPFTATSLQFLALKIVKGSFTPIPNHYSKQLKNLLTMMLQLDPNKRPSINDIFKNPLIQDRIKNFLTQTKRNHEFSHTILHNHKVQLISNRLVEMKQQKDFEKQRNKLKQEQQLIKQKLQRKRSQDKMKIQQQQIRQKQSEREREKDKERMQSMQKLKNQKERQQQKRRQLIQRQRKQFQKKQNVLDQQKRKQQIQRRAQKQYEENQKMAKYYEQKRRQEQQIKYIRQKNNQMMYLQNQKQQQDRKNLKQRKIQDKQIQEEKKKKQLQQFARKQYFENQQIMRRAKQRANQDQYRQNFIQPPKIEKISSKKQITDIYSQKTPQNINYQMPKNAQNFHYQSNNNNKKVQTYEPTQQQIQNAFVNPNFNKRSSNPGINKPTNVDKYQSNKVSNQRNQNNQKQYDSGNRQQVQKKQSSVRQQMKKDRQNFLKNKDYKNSQKQIFIEQTKQPIINVETVKGAKWQRPKSRQKQTQQTQQTQQNQNNFNYPQQIKQDQQKMNGQRTYDLFGTKISPNDQLQFNQYLKQLQGLLRNVNRNISEVQTNANNQNNSDKKIAPQKSQTQSPKTKNKNSSVLSQMPQQQQIVYREDDQDILKFSMTAEFPNQEKLSQKSLKKLPQIQTSTDLDYFSNFSKLQTLRMNLQDKFGTDNFVKIYRYLQQQMSQKGLQGFSNVNQVIQQTNTKIKVDKVLLMESFALLLTLIHMEQKMMSN